MIPEMKDPLHNGSNSFDDDIPDFRELFIHNDDVNELTHVLHSLVTVLNIHPRKAVEIGFAAETEGKASCKVDTPERCQEFEAALSSLGLTMSVEEIGEQA